MRIEEIEAVQAVDFSPHHHAFLNPYNGCPMGCPFCFWLDNPGWEGRIIVKKNYPELLKRYLETEWDGGLLYLGSVCDPFMELEKEYRLTKMCLNVLQEYEVPLLITTSAAGDVILEYMDLLRSMVKSPIVVVELSRIPLIEEMNRGGSHRGIEHANALVRAGLKTWATLSPVLPGVTSIKKVLSALDDTIPVYVDALRCEPGGIQQKKVMEWIRRDYPDQSDQYEQIVMQGDDGYFKELVEMYRGQKRVKTFPFEID